MYKAVLLDLDGTLLDNEKRISEENIKTGVKTCEVKGNAFAAVPCLFCMCKRINRPAITPVFFKLCQKTLDTPFRY